MPTHRPAPPRTRQQVAATADTSDPAGRAIYEVVDAVRRLETRVRDSASQTVDLVVGDNQIAHRLGRKPIGAIVSPTVADATFAWAMTAADEETMVIEVVGVAQPDAGIEVF
jgi:hypothetical protein